MNKQGGRFSKHVLITLASRIVLASASAATGVVVARSLGAEGVGFYAVLTLSVNILVQIMGSGVASANILFAKREPSRAGSMLANSVIFAAVTGLIGGAMVLAAASLRPEWFGNVPRDLLLIALAALPFQIAVLLGLNLIVSSGDIGKFNLLDALTQGFLFVNAAVVLYAMRSDLTTLMIANAILGLSSAAIVILSAARSIDRERYGLHYSVDLPMLTRMIRFGLTINFMNSALALVLRADVILVNYFRGEAEAGVYAIATQCSLLLIMFPNVVGTMLLPRVATMTQAGEFTARVVRRAALIQAVVSGIAVPFSFALPWVFGERFGASVPIFLILVPGSFALGMQMLLSQHLVAIGSFSRMPMFWIVTVAVSIGLNFVLIPKFGAVGAALASSVAYSVIFAATLAYFIRQTGQTARMLFVSPGLSEKGRP